MSVPVCFQLIMFNFKFSSIMKKNLFIVISMMMVAFLVATSCGNSAKQKENVIKTIGSLSVVERTTDDGTTGFTMIDSAGIEVTYSLYKDITDEGNFIKALTFDGKVEIYHPNGRHAVSGDSIKVKNYYATGEKPSAKQYLELSFGERVNAFDLEKIESLLHIESSREQIYPLDNGLVIYAFDRHYGLAKVGADEPELGNICSEITVICLKDKVVYLIKSDDFTGYVNDKGEGIKQLSRAQYKKALKAGKLLWEDGKVSARQVSKI